MSPRNRGKITATHSLLWLKYSSHGICYPSIRCLLRAVIICVNPSRNGVVESREFWFIADTLVLCFMLIVAGMFAVVVFDNTEALDDLLYHRITVDCKALVMSLLCLCSHCLPAAFVLSSGSFCVWLGGTYSCHDQSLWVETHYPSHHNSSCHSPSITITFKFRWLDQQALALMNQ